MIKLFKTKQAIKQFQDFTISQHTQSKQTHNINFLFNNFFLLLTSKFIKKSIFKSYCESRKKQLLKIQQIMNIQKIIIQFDMLSLLFFLRMVYLNAENRFEIIYKAFSEDNFNKKDGILKTAISQYYPENVVMRLFLEFNEHSLVIHQLLTIQVFLLTIKQIKFHFYF
ncbi:unnamed protein product [Paramecium pentaurelia]|uniref:Uncharacterized protein n=1 Tax=Paramecium pentaurelia TaxID=43138 RepID=A0A8S1X6Z2_9CILI|nr:unnamed protein product [Paramecium pentaurelia]